MCVLFCDGFEGSNWKPPCLIGTCASHCLSWGPVTRAGLAEGAATHNPPLEVTGSIPSHFSKEP